MGSMREVMNRVKRLEHHRQSTSIAWTNVIFNDTIEKARQYAGFFRLLF